MTPERKELIDKFQKFFDTEPTRNIILTRKEPKNDRL